MRFFARAVVASRRCARCWSSPPAPRRARAPAASTPHAHDTASFRNLAAPARTDDRRTNDATSGPQEWLTESLHEGGIRSVRSPLRRDPLLATPIATPLQCSRPERSGLLFLKLLVTRERRRNQQSALAVPERVRASLKKSARAERTSWYDRRDVESGEGRRAVDIAVSLQTPHGVGHFTRRGRG